MVAKWYWSAVVLVIAGGGCDSGGSGPSYADLVVTYNAEVEALDRLQDKREKLLAEFAKENQPDMEDAVKALAGALQTASEPADAADPAAAADPFAALDEAVARAEQTGQVTSDVLDSVIQSTEAAAKLELNEAQRKQLDELDAQIKEQQARVDRARAARDAAEEKK